MRSSQSQWLQWFIKPARQPDSFVEQERATRLLVYLGMLVLLTTINLIIWMLSGSVDAFTFIGCGLSIVLYALAKVLPPKRVAVTTSIIALVLPYILYLITPGSLTLMGTIFLLVVSLLTASQFLSLRSNLQLAIIALVSSIFLIRIAVPDTSFTPRSLLIPVLIVMSLTLLNAYGHEGMMTYLTETVSSGTDDHKFLRDTVNLIPEPAIIEHNKRIMAANAAVATLFRTSPEIMVGEPIADFLKTTRSKNYRIDSSDERPVIRYQDELLNVPDGERNIVEVAAWNVDYQDGTAVLMLLRPLDNPLSYEDLVSEHLNKTDLPDMTRDENERIFQALAASMADYAYSITVTDEKNKSIDWVIGNYTDKIGLDDAQILTLGDWSEVIHEDDLPFYNLRTRALYRGETRTLEYRIIHRDGSLRWMQDTAYPLLDESTGTIHRIMAVVMDVTERNLAQETLKSNVVQQAVIAELGLLALNTTDHSHIIEHVTILCEQVLSSGFVAIYEYHAADEQLICTSLSRDDAPIAIGHAVHNNYLHSLPAYALHTGEIVVSDDLADEPRFRPIPDILDNGYGSAIGIGVIGKDAVPFGVLTVYSQFTHDFTRDEKYFLQAITNVLGTFIERNRALIAEQEEAKFAEALREATIAVNARLELREVLTKIINYVQQVAPQTEQASIMLLNEESSRYYHYVTYGFGDDAPEIEAQYAFSPADFPLLQEMIETYEPISVEDVTRDPRWIMRDTVSDTRSYLGTPIVINNRIIGFINLHGYSPGAFDDSDAKRVKTFAATTGTAIANARKQEDLEREVEQRTAELKQQSGRMSTIIEGTGDGIFYTENERIDFVNETLCKLTGYKESELVGQTTTILQPDDATIAEVEKLSSIIETARTEKVWYEQVRLRRKDGETFEAGLTVSILDSPDDVLRSVTIVRDMSKEAELDELKRTLIASAAHDLRSPITSLQMRMHMIRNHPDKLDYHMKRLDYIIDRMNNLVTLLLESYGRISLTLRPLILQELLNQVVDILKPESEMDGVAFHYSAPSEPIGLLADRDRLEQVFFNLITNAMHYTDPDDEIHVSYHVDEAKNMVFVYISDTGIGINQNELNNIFLPFYRAEGNTRKGTGLGLSITHEIIMRHNGTISVESVKGEGSTFTVGLPLIDLDTQ